MNRGSINILLLIVLFASAGFLAYKSYQFYYPCNRPVTYKIGMFDESFGISRGEFLTAIHSAEKIWEDAIGKNFFEYDGVDGDMSMNLVYDYRQDTSNKLETLEGSVEAGQETYDRLKSEYNSLKAEYDRAKAAYESRYRTFEQRYKTHQDQVAFWNKKGGAPDKEYSQLNAEGQAIQNELQSLKAEQARINSMAQQLNALVARLNTLASDLKLTVENYNDIGASLGESFEEGLYQYENGRQSISIYEFSDRAELIRVLAHELGHALRVDHVDDSRAIMYSVNKSTSLTLSQSDIEAVKEACNI